MKICEWKVKMLDEINPLLESLREKLEALTHETTDYVNPKGSETFRYFAKDFCEYVGKIKIQVSEALTARDSFKSIPGRNEKECVELDKLIYVMHSRIKLGNCYYTYAFNAWFYARQYALTDSYVPKNTHTSIKPILPSKKDKNI